MKQPFVKTENFTLRPLQKTDTASLAKQANNNNVSRFLAETFPYPYTLNDAKKFIKTNVKEIVKKKPRFLTFGIEINQEIVGVIGIHLTQVNHSAEIGFWLGEEYWDKKIMTNATKEIIKYCFRKLKLQRIEAKFLVANIASKKILAKNHFKKEGVLRKALFKKNKFYDLVLMARIK